MNVKRTFILFALLLATGTSVSLAENWKRVAQSTSVFKTYAVFNGEIFACSETMFNNRTIKKSTDAVHWQSISDQFPGNFPTPFFRTHKNYLYAFSFVAHSKTTDFIYRTADGISWQPVSTVAVSTQPVEFLDALSFGDFLYVLYFDGTMVRTRGGSTVTWEIIPAPASWPVHNPQTTWRSASLAVFNGSLHMALLRPDPADSELSTKDIFKLAGTMWQSMGTIELENLRYTEEIKLFSAYNKLYLMGQYLWSTSSNEAPYIWQKEMQSIVNSPVKRAVPNILNGKLYIWSVEQPVFHLDAIGNTTPASNQSQGTTYGGSNHYFNDAPAIIGNKAYVASLFENWYLELGIQSITNLPLPPASDLMQGQTKVTVAAMSIKTNLDDGLKFSLKNAGSALDTADIGKVTVVASDGRSVDMVVDATDKRVWHLPAFFPVAQDMELYITADISPRATLGRTLLFVVDPASFEVTQNKAFEPGPVFTSQSLEIIPGAAANNASENIKEVLVYPQPARDTIQFVYDLAGAAEITVKIYDRQGTLISEITDANKPAGARAITTWDASKNAAGVYYATIKISQGDGTEKFFKRKVVVER